MIFIIKKRKIVLDLFTHRQVIFDSAKPKLATHFYPDWWKDLKTELPLDNGLFPTATMRRCMGFVDHYKHGFILPLWSDFRIKLGKVGDPNFEAMFSDNITRPMSHPHMLRGSYLPDEKYVHIKMVTPWAAKCKESIYWKWEQPTYGFKQPNRAIVLPGTIEYKYQYSMNVNVMFARQENDSLLQLDYQEPLVHITPISERPLELRHHMVSFDEYAKMMQGEKLSNINFYRSTRRVRESEEKKCPFGFGGKK